MRTIGTARSFRPDDVPDEVVYRAAEAARFAPQGGNRQPVRLVVVRDPAKKARLGELYERTWRPYFESRAGADPSRYSPAQRAMSEFAARFGEHPLILVVCARHEDLLVTDLGLDRPSVVGGASIYPYVQNLCIALRVEGVATALTTALCRVEPEVRELLGIPDEYLTACHLAAGYPAQGFPTKLRRRPVEETVFVDAFGANISQSARHT
jgi:nitroreductase